MNALGINVSDLFLRIGAKTEAERVELVALRSTSTKHSGVTHKLQAVAKALGRSPHISEGSGSPKVIPVLCVCEDDPPRNNCKRCRLIRRGFFGVLDDDGLDRCFACFQLEAKLLNTTHDGTY